MKQKKVFILWLVILLGSFIMTFAQSQMDEYYHLLYEFKADSWSDFGNAVYLAADVNGDGYGDILIGADGEYVGSLKSAGRAYVYSGFDGKLLYTYSGENDYAFLGRALSDIDDTNGDGLHEILIGADGTDNQRGKVYHCSGVDGTVIREYHGETLTDSFGNDLEGIGDVDGDGYGDFVVGAEGFEDNSTLHRGAVYVFSGNPGMAIYKLLYKYEGSYTAEQMGYKVCRMGDVDNDWIGDFAYLTLNNKTGSPANGGRVTIRSGVNGSLIHEIFGNITDAKLNRIEYGGDVNGDGYPDLLVGQPSYNNGSITYTGRAFIYSGKDWRMLYIFVGKNDTGVLGGSLATAGDVNNDGYCDFIIGAHGSNDLGIWLGGAAYIHSGKDGSLLGVVYGDANNDMVGISVHGGGDVNGDGLPDIIIGTSEDDFTIPASGSALVYTAKSLKATDEVPLGGILELSLRVPAQPIGIYYIGFSLGTDPGIPIGTRKFPLNWDTLFVNTFGNPLLSGTLDALGEKQVSLPIANNPSLSGLTFYAAFLTLEKGKPMGVRTISNPEKIVLK